MPVDITPIEPLLVDQIGRKGAMTLAEYVEAYDLLVRGDIISREQFLRCYALPLPDLRLVSAEIIPDWDVQP